MHWKYWLGEWRGLELLVKDRIGLKYWAVSLSVGLEFLNGSYQYFRIRVRSHLPPSIPMSARKRSKVMEPDPIRFGIIGCATIARKLSRAIALAPNAVITAAGSRSVEKARRFIADNGLPSSVRAHGSYADVIDDPGVDAVYVPLPTGLHVRWAVEAAEKGKHVLLEKPAAASGSDLERILEACGSSGVQFMDGTMWMHHPRTAKMRELLSDPNRFGPPKVIHCTSTFSAPPDFFHNNIRVNPELDSLGALGDLGWYCAAAILWATDYRLPDVVTALPSLERNPSGVILSCTATCHWMNDDILAKFHCSFLSNVSMHLSVHGTNGSLQVKDLAIPYDECSASFHFNSGAKLAELHIGWTRKPEEKVVGTDIPQEALMVQEFARLVGCIRDSGCCPDTKWPEITRRTQMLIDAVKRSIESDFKPVEL